MFAWLISHQPAVLFSQNKPAINNQTAVPFAFNKPAPAISHQPNEQAAGFVGDSPEGPLEQPEESCLKPAKKQKRNTSHLSART
jgi:hypothetical protein